MKYIKNFENYEDTPKIGDYVLIKTYASDVNIKKYINNTIGKLIRTAIYNSVVIEYENPPNDIRTWFSPGYDKNIFTRNFNIEQIVEFADTKEELELKLDSNKYNL